MPSENGNKLLLNSKIEEWMKIDRVSSSLAYSFYYIYDIHVVLVVRINKTAIHIPTILLQYMDASIHASDLS